MVQLLYGLRRGVCDEVRGHRLSQRKRYMIMPDRRIYCLPEGEQRHRQIWNVGVRARRGEKVSCAHAFAHIKARA